MGDKNEKRMGTSIKVSPLKELGESWFNNDSKINMENGNYYPFQNIKSWDSNESADETPVNILVKI